jgi:pSer/pThr/pTyr-binding forkhead associated (FHA) protein
MEKLQFLSVVYKQEESSMLKLILSGAEKKEVELNQPRITVGRDSSNDIVLSAAGVSGFHAEFHCDQGRVFLVDVGSSNGTFINGKKISGRQELKAWDKLRFESVEAELVDPEGRRPTTVSRAVTDADLSKVAAKATQVGAAVGGWTLVGKDAPVGDKTFPLSGTLVIGREANCDIPVDSPQISRRHAEISLSGDTATIKDLGSSNGTFVNGNKVTQAALKSGDEIKIDKIRFAVQGPAAVSNATQVRPAVGNATQIRPAASANARTVTQQATNATTAMPAVGARLVASGADNKGKNHALAGSQVTVGRTDGNDIVLSDSTMSGKHAKLTSVGGRWQLEDLGSTNGSFVNGKKVTKQELKGGDSVRFGKLEFKFEGAGAGAGATSGTAVMPAVGNKTAVMPAQKKKMPAWVYGIAGFAVVVIALLVVFGGGIFGGPQQIDAKLQGGKLWSQQLPNDRKGPATPVLADINGDEYLDVIVADANGFVLALDGLEGKKIFEAEVSDRILAPVVAGDLSGDGIADIVVASNSGIVVALNGKGQTLWKTSNELGLGEVINRPLLADVNNDNIVDVLVPTSNRGLVALDGAHGWEIWNTAEMTRGKVITAPLQADLNDDGVSDFVLLTDSGQVLAVTSQQGKVWSLWEAQTAPIYYASPLYIEVNGEESLIAVATDNGGVIALNAQSGRMAWISNLQKRFFSSPVAVDANGDEVADVVAIDSNGDIFVLDALTGDEIWSSGLGAKVQASAALFDMDNDGRNDLFLLDAQGNLNVVDMGRGRTTLAAHLANKGYMASPVLGDVNNDGLLDVIAAAQDGSLVAYGINRSVAKGSAPWPAFLGQR